MLYEHLSVPFSSLFLNVESLGERFSHVIQLIRQAAHILDFFHHVLWLQVPLFPPEYCHVQKDHAQELYVHQHARCTLAPDINQLKQCIRKLFVVHGLPPFVVSVEVLLPILLRSRS